MNHHIRVARNILALLINQLGTWSITLVLTLFVPPYLGVRNYGVYSFVVTYANFCALLMGIGTSTYLTWRIARDPEQASRLTFNTLIMQIPLGLLVSTIALVLLPVLDSDPMVLAAEMGILLSTIFATFMATCVAALGGFQIMRTPAFINLGMSALSAGLVLLAVHLNLGLLALIAAVTFSQVVATLVMLVYTQRRIHLRPQLDLRLWPSIVVGGLPFFGWSAILVLYSQINIPLLKALSGDTAVGWFSIANRITGIPVFLPSIVITAILPALSHERSAASPAFRSLASRGLRLVTAVGIPACVGTVALAPTVIHLLHYPDSFSPAAPVIVILAFNMPVVALDMVLGTVLVALGRQKAWMVVGLVAGVTTSLVNLWLIPYTQRVYANGAIGAALTTLLSEVIMFCGAMLLRPRSIFTRGDVWYMARCLLAAVIMLPAVGLGSQGGIHLYRSVAYGMFVYALAAYALQVVTNNDLKGLVLVVSNRLGIETLEELQAVSLGVLLRLRSGTRSRVARAGAVLSQPLVRTGAIVSQPLARARAALSQPLSQARAAVSQPLAHAGERVGATASRYWPHEEAPAGNGSASYNGGYTASSNGSYASTNGGYTGSNGSHADSYSGSYGSSTDGIYADRYSENTSRIHVDGYVSSTNGNGNGSTNGNSSGGYGSASHDAYTGGYEELPVTAPLPGREIDRRVAAGSQSHARRDVPAQQTPNEIDESDVPTVPRHPRVLSGPRPDLSSREAARQAGH